MKSFTRLILLFLSLFASGCAEQKKSIQKKVANHRIVHGAIIRGDTTKKILSIVFTGDEFGEGGHSIINTLQKQHTSASFFLTGRFYRNTEFKNIILQLKKDGHYLGAHSDAHLLYCDWVKRDSLLVTKEQFRIDLLKNYEEMKKFGINKNDARYFLPPYEWYNDSIATWTKQMELQLISFTPGTLTHADYTTPSMKNYRSSDAILRSLYDYEQKRSSGLNGFILLMHIGSGPERTNKFYDKLEEILVWLKQQQYQVVTIDKLLGN